MNRLMAVLRWRRVRWLAVAVVVPTLWACGARKLVEPRGGPSQVIKNRFQQAINRDLDLLFVIDDSQSMAPLQEKLRAQMPTFMNRLEMLPGGLPNLHVAVISTSLGAGIFSNVSGCVPGTIGNLNGAFQHSASCTALPADQKFLKAIGMNRNFTGNIADVFNCIANIGASGCGFEHQFEATRLALQRAQNPNDPDNAGFLRPDAYLGVIMLTNEDDCSVPPESMLFDPNQQTLADPLGGLQSYRCNEFGHLCNGMTPPHNVTADQTLTGCVSAEDGKLVTVQGFVQFLKGLKPNNPNQVMVAAIAGPTEPYTVRANNLMLANGMMEMQPQIVHSCTQPTSTPNAPAEYADPAIRIKQWLDGFSNSVLQSICAPDFRDSMNRIADVIGRTLGVQCVPTNIQMRPDGSWDCDVTERTGTGATLADREVPQCDAGRSVVPCWEFRADAQCMNNTQVLRICYDAACDEAAKPMNQADALVSCSIAL